MASPLPSFHHLDSQWWRSESNLVYWDTPIYEHQGRQLERYWTKSKSEDDWTRLMQWRWKRCKSHHMSFGSGFVFFAQVLTCSFGWLYHTVCCLLFIVSMLFTELIWFLIQLFYCYYDSFIKKEGWGKPPLHQRSWPAELFQVVNSLVHSGTPSSSVIYGFSFSQLPPAPNLIPRLPIGRSSHHSNTRSSLDGRMLTFANTVLLKSWCYLHMWGLAV